MTEIDRLVRRARRASSHSEALIADSERLLLARDVLLATRMKMAREIIRSGRELCDAVAAHLSTLP